MKKFFIAIAVLLLLCGVVGAYFLLAGNTGKQKFLYIATNGANRDAVMDSLVKNGFVKSPKLFYFLADRAGYWSKIKPGRYEITPGTNLIGLVRKLRNGQQAPVKMVITKLRTKKDLARVLGNLFEPDSASVIALINNNDSLQRFGADTNSVMTLVMPDTYQAYWNSSPTALLEKLADYQKKYWTDERKRQAEAQGLNPEQAYIVASIVEEETNATKEKGTIASVYLNRLRRGMPLQADPTVKFALQDFTLRRIYEKHLLFPSPYNTYRNKGLPPGPICTPSKTTLNAVLTAPKTDYLYFVASPAFDGTHLFSVSYPEHLQKAKQYQQALNELQAKRGTP